MEQLGERELTDEEKKSIAKVFRQIDTYGNGKIGASELQRAARLVGGNPTREEAEEMIRSCDTDEDGSVDLAEFETCMKQVIMMKEYHKSRLIEAFYKFDKSGTGFLNKKELARVLRNYGDNFTPEEEEEFFNLVDEDNNGEVSVEEFVKFFTEIGS